MLIGSASDTFGMPRINTASWLGPEHGQEPVKSTECRTLTYCMLALPSPFHSLSSPSSFLLLPPWIYPTVEKDLEALLPPTKYWSYLEGSGVVPSTSVLLGVGLALVLRQGLTV